MLESRTLLSISANLNPTTKVLTFNGATSNDQIILFEADVDNHGSVDGFAAVYDDGTGSATHEWSFDAVTSITVDLSSHAGTTLTLANVHSAAWSFTDPITYTGAGSTSTLETQGVDTTWTLAQDSGLIGNVNNTVGTGHAISFSGVGFLTADSNTINTLVGENNTLAGDNVASTWTLGTLATPPSSTYYDGTNTVNFSGFTTVQSGLTSAGTHHIGDTFNLDFDNMPEIDTNLVGGAGNDTFNFNSADGGGLLTGNIDGGGGINTIDLSNYDSPATVKLDSSVVSGAVNAGTIPTSMVGAYFNNINNLTGNSGWTDQLTGLDVTSTWAVSSSSTYQATVSSTSWNIGFSGFQVLQGGTGSDTFNVSTGITGSLDGGGTPGGRLRPSLTSRAVAPSPTASSARAATPRSTTPR